nr:PHP domain-containing protein [Eggerthella sinensis]
MQTFKKCDLHVHSSSCESRDYTYNDFKKALLDSDLDVIAITDHNSVDVELMNQLSAALSLRGKTLLAGVELNVKIDDDTCKKHNLVVSTTTEYFHGIIWCDLADAEKLRDLVFRLLDGIGITEQIRSGKTAREISSLSTGKAFFLKDIQRGVGDLKHFFTFHESKGDKRRNLSGYLENGKGGNDKFKHSLFYYNQHLAIEGGKKSKPISDFFEMDLNPMVCRFFCSDAKSLEKIGSAFTWIDFDGDIDSFNLAITDPQSRIVTSDECQSNPQSNLNAYLKSVKFNLLDEDDNPSECEVEFAPSYNGIVGSRGSGKSMLARILSGQISGGYEKYIDPESVRFRMKGGQYSKNLPKCLYVKQGELGVVFDNSDYKSVPFLESRLKKMKESAKATSDQHYADAVTQLDYQQRIICAFIEKYKGFIKRPDALQRAKPNGISIKDAPAIQSGQLSICEMGKQAERLGEKLEVLEEKVSDLHAEEQVPESSLLLDALNARVEHASNYTDMYISGRWG